MFKNMSVEGVSVRLIVVAVGSYLAFFISDWVSGFFVHFVPDWFSYFIPAFFGYSLTGFLFGLGLWLAFKHSGKQIIMLSPLFLVLAILVDNYIYFNNAGDSQSFAPWRILELLFTSLRGFYLLILIPGVAFLTIMYFSSKQGDLKLQVKKTQQDALQIKNKLNISLINMFASLWVGTDAGGKMISIAFLLTAFSLSMNWFTIGHILDFGPGLIDFIVLGVCWAYPVLMILKNSKMAFKQGIVCSVISMLWMFWSFFKMFQNNEYQLRNSEFWLSPELGFWIALIASLLFTGGVLTSAWFEQTTKRKKLLMDLY